MAKGKSNLFSSVLESLGFSRRKSRARRKQRLLKLESLENRRLLTANIVLNKSYTITDDGSHLFEGPTTPYTGDVINYTITLTNSDVVGGVETATEATNVVVTDDLTPANDGATLTGTPAASSPQLGNLSADVSVASNLLTFQASGANGFVLPGGDSLTITYSAIVTPGAYFVKNEADGTFVDPTQAGTQNMVPADVFISAVPFTPTPLVNIAVQQSVITSPSQPLTSDNVTYEVVVSNKGPSDATYVPLYDSSESGELTINGWTVDPSQTTGSSDVILDQTTTPPSVPTTPITSGTGDVAELLNVPANTQIAFQVSATLDSSLPGGSVVTNTAYTEASSTDVDTDPSQWVSNTNVEAPTAPADITIAKSAFTDTPGNTVTPGAGTSITGLYTITVTNGDTNTGDAAVAGITVADGLNTQALSGLSWTALDSDGTNANNNVLTGTGSIDQSVTLSPQESLTYTISGEVNANAEYAAGGDDLSNTATLTMPSDVTDSAGTTATAELALTPSVALTVTKSDNVGSADVTPGASVTYTIAVSNSGPSDATKVNLTDALGAGSNASGASWSETSPGTLSGTGALNATIADLPSATTATFTEVVPIASGATAGSTSDTASATSPDITGSVSSTPATVVNIGSPVSALKVTKLSGSASAVPGAAVTYTVTVSNEGPSDATSVSLTDTVDGAIAAGSVGWSTTPSGTVTSGTTYSLGTVTAGQTATVYVHATVLSDAATTLGLSSTTDTISVSGTTATIDSVNSSLSDTQTLTPQADLGVTKTDNLGGNSAVPGDIGEVTPGNPVTYTITVTNIGPSDVTGATVSDTLPTQVNSGDLLSVTPTGSATSTAATGSLSTLSDTVNMPAGSSIVYVISAVVGSPLSVSEFTNTATVAVPNGVTDPVSADNSATVTDGLPVDLSITKTDSAGGSSVTPAIGSAVPGTSITYTITVTNAGPAVATGAKVSDTFPAVLTGLKLVSVTPTGSATSGATTGSISGLSDTVNLPASSSITYVVSAAIPSSDTTQLSNSATVTAPTGVPNIDTTNTTATDVDNLTPQGDLSITKSDSDGGNSVTSATGTAIPGNTITYTIVASNSGPSDVTGAAITDTLPTGFTVSSSTGSGTGGASGYNNSPGGTASPVNMPAGSSIKYVIAGTLSASLAAGPLANTATIAAPASGFTDTNSANNSATSTDTLVPTGNLRITKTDNVGGSSVTGVAGNTPPGTAISYTITVTNSGPSNMTGVTVSDALPTTQLTSPDLVSVTPSVSPAATNVTNLTPGPITSLSDVVNLPVGSSITYVISGTVSASATGTLSNTATLTVPTGQTNSGNSSATDTDTLTKADLVLSVSGQTTAVTGQNVIYGINVTNYGPGTAQNTVVTDTLPAGMTFVSATSSNAAMLPVATTVNANGTTTVTFTGASMGVGAAASSAEAITIDATVNANAATGATLTNNVAVSTPTTQAANAGHSPVGSASFATQVNVDGASLVPSVLSPGKTDLVITDGGSSVNTVIALPSAGKYLIYTNGRLQGSFLPTGRIVVYGNWAKNSIAISEDLLTTVSLPVWLYGGSGRNYLYGGSGNNVIVGGPGMNYIWSGAGRSLLIGGGGGGSPNYILGSTGSNIEISGTTSFDANQAALNAILQEWDGANGDAFNVRVQKLTQTGMMVNGLNVVLNSSTIQRAAAYEYLYGGLGQNMFFATETGSVFDRDYVIGCKKTDVLMQS